MTDEQKHDLIESSFFDQVNPTIEQSFFQKMDVSKLETPVLNNPVSKQKSSKTVL